VRATEAAAMAAARLLGRGVDEEVECAAVDAIRSVLGTIPMRGLVVIGEAGNDYTPMLYRGFAKRLRSRRNHIQPGVGLSDCAAE
jgi:fructose-1,6-bisphosphatase II